MSRKEIRALIREASVEDFLAIFVFFPAVMFILIFGVAVIR